jgi:hypothetical protein
MRFTVRILERGRLDYETVDVRRFRRFKRARVWAERKCGDPVPYGRPGHRKWTIRESSR